MSNEVNEILARGQEMYEIKSYVKEYLKGYRPEVNTVLDTFTNDEWIDLYNQIMKGKQHG